VKPLGYLLAVVWTLAWGWCRVAREILRHVTRWGDMAGCTAPIRAHMRWAWMWGRHDSPEPVECFECGWAGPRRWAVHTYYPDGWDDVEPVDECPRCGYEI